MPTSDDTFTFLFSSYAVSVSIDDGIVNMIFLNDKTLSKQQQDVAIDVCTRINDKIVLGTCMVKESKLAFRYSTSIDVLASVTSLASVLKEMYKSMSQSFQKMVQVVELAERRGYVKEAVAQYF